MNGPEKLYQLLAFLNIPFEYIEHPEAPTIEIARQYWKGHDAKHCKNLFLDGLSPVAQLVSGQDTLRFTMDTGVKKTVRRDGAAGIIETEIYA